MGFFGNTTQNKQPIQNPNMTTGSFFGSVPTKKFTLTPQTPGLSTPVPGPRLGFFEGFKQRLSSLKDSPESVKEKQSLARETIKGLPAAFSEQIGQPTLRSYAGLGSLLTGQTLTPKQGFEQELYGTDKPLTAEASGRELIGDNAPAWLAVGVGGTLGAADLIPGAPGNNFKNLVRSLSKLKDAKQIASLLEKEAPVLKGTDDIASLANLLSKTTDEPQIAKSLQFAIERNSPARTTGYTIDNPPPLKPGEELVAFERTGGDIQWVTRDLSPESIARLKIDPAKVEVMAVPKESVTKPSGLKGEFGEGIVDRKVVDGLTTTERKFITSAKNLSPDNTKLAGQYVPRSTDELAIKARNFITSDPVAAEKIALTESGENAVAIASELMKKYADDAANAADDVQRAAFYDKQAEIANIIAPKLTEQGRAIQAASILGRMTPEGQLRFAAREIQKYNEANPLKKIPELTGEQAGFISTEMKAINAMPDGIDKAMRFQKLQNYVQDVVPTPTMKKVITAWKAGLLTGIKTTGLNIFSNAFHGLSEVVKDAPAALVDRAASLFTGKRAKTFTVKKAFSGIKEGSVKGVRYFSTGFDERNIGEKLDYTRVNFGKGPVAKAMNAYTNVVFRSLGAGDQPFYYAALSRSMMDQALAEGMNQGLKGKALVNYAYRLVENPTEEMLRYGVADATTAVFQNKTALGNVAAKIQQSSDVTQVILPFARTPSAVVMQVLAYSPVGIAKTIIENIGKGKFDQRLFSQGVGRGITGTAVIAIGMELARRGLISEDFPRGDERQQELDKAEGRTPNSIKVGNNWVSPIALGPLGNLLLVGGHIQRGIESKGSPTEAAGEAAVKIAKSFTEQTFLTGVKNFIDGVSEPETFLTQYLPNLVASGVPTIVADVAKSIDPLERTSSGLVESIAKRIPGARETLEPQVTAFGEQRPRPANPLNTMLNPARPSPDTSTPVTTELRRLHEAGFKVSPTKVGEKKGYPSLSEEENTALWELVGEMVDGKLQLLVELPNYQKLDDEQKAKAIESVVTKSKNYGRAAFVIQLTEGLEGDALVAKMTELRDSGLLTKDVLRAYQELR